MPCAELLSSLPHRQDQVAGGVQAHGKPSAGRKQACRQLPRPLYSAWRPARPRVCQRPELANATRFVPSSRLCQKNLVTHCARADNFSFSSFHGLSSVRRCLAEADLRLVSDAPGVESAHPAPTSARRAYIKGLNYMYGFPS